MQSVAATISISALTPIRHLNYCSQHDKIGNKGLQLGQVRQLQRILMIPYH